MIRAAAMVCALSAAAFAQRPEFVRIPRRPPPPRRLHDGEVRDHRGPVCGVRQGHRLPDNSGASGQPAYLACTWL